MKIYILQRGGEILFVAKFREDLYSLKRVRFYIMLLLLRFSLKTTYDLWYQEGIKDRTNQGFTNISSSRGSTIMFDLLKSFSQLCLAIYEEKIDFFLSISTLKGLENV